MEGPTTFCGSGKMLRKKKEPQCCLCLTLWHSVNTLPQHTHTHPWPCHAFFAKASDFFAPGAHPDGKEIGMWRHLALLSPAFVYALCTFMMKRCPVGPVGPKFSERQENFKRCKAYR